MTYLPGDINVLLVGAMEVKNFWPFMAEKINGYLVYH
jgi:hypothetical protein